MKQVPVAFTARLKNPAVYTSKEGTFEEHSTAWIRQAKKESRDGLIYISKEKTFGKVRQALLFSPRTQIVKSSLRSAGGAGSGNFGHEGRPGEVGGSGSGGTAPRTFTTEEGYAWHEKGPVAEWAKQLSYADHQALGGYASFGYHDINDQLRGTYKPLIINEFVREATPEEIARVDNRHPIEGIEMDRVTAESIAKYGHPFAKDVKDFSPDDPYQRVADGRIVTNQFYRPVEGGPTMMYSIQRAVPDLKYVEKITEDAARLDNLIAERGYVLPEAMQLGRAAYFPGVSYDELKASEGTIREEKGFSSTMVGDANRLNGYVAMGKSESIYNRYIAKTGQGKIRDYENEVGSAVRIHIDVPEGTKVASIEASRRLEYDFPRNEDPQSPDYMMRDWKGTPTVKDASLSDPQTRTESEVLLGSGAHFQVVSVKRAENYVTSDPSLKPVSIIDMHMRYVGGGSSEPRKK